MNVKRLMMLAWAFVTPLDHSQTQSERPTLTSTSTVPRQSTGPTATLDN